MKTTLLKPLVVIVALLTALPVYAWPKWLGGGKAEAEPAPAAQPAENRPRLIRKYVLHVPDKNTEAELLALFRERKQTEQDILLLRRLSDEKARQYAGLQQALQKEYGILPEVQYQYDKEKMIIYELVPESKQVNVNEDSAVASTNGFEQAAQGDLPTLSRRLQKDFETEEQAAPFLRMVRDKKLLQDEARCIQAMQREKEAALKKVDDLLGQKFSLKTGGRYDYDSKTMRLFEIVPAGGADTVPENPEE